MTLFDTFFVAIFTAIIALITAVITKRYDQKKQSEELFFKEKLLAYKQFLDVAYREFRATNSEIDIHSIQFASAPAMLLSTKATSDLISNYCLREMQEHQKLHGNFEEVKNAKIIETADAYEKMFFSMQEELLSYHHLPFRKRLLDSAKALRNH